MHKNIISIKNAQQFYIIIAFTVKYIFDNTCVRKVLENATNMLRLIMLADKKTVS